VKKNRINYKFDDKNSPIPLDIKKFNFKGLDESDEENEEDEN